MRRFLTLAAAGVALLVVLAVVAVGWYYSGEILVVEPVLETRRETEVLAVGRRAVTLERTDEALLPGTWGLDAPEAYARVGEILDRDAERVRRTLQPITGTLRRGDVADIASQAYPGDPAEAFDFDVSEIELSGPLGPQPAWFAPGQDQRRWAVLVHGRAGARHECFRLLQILHDDHGFNVVCSTYRNDEGAPPDPAGIYHQGAQEWRDVESAVQFAVDEGAEEVVVGGFSMGGQITANLLRHSPLARHVDAAIWDSPLLDWGPAITAAARDRGVPEWIVPLGMQASEWRAGVDYEALNQTAHADEFDVPILVLHGTDDGTVPISVTAAFARARPDIVTFERFQGAGHVTAWNSFPGRYRQAVARFIANAF